MFIQIKFLPVIITYSYKQINQITVVLNFTSVIWHWPIPFNYPGVRRFLPNCCSEYTASCMWIQKRSFPRAMESYEMVRGSSVLLLLISCRTRFKRHTHEHVHYSSCRKNTGTQRIRDAAPLDPSLCCSAHLQTAAAGKSSSSRSDICRTGM